MTTVALRRRGAWALVADGLIWATAGTISRHADDHPGLVRHLHRPDERRLAGHNEQAALEQVRGPEPAEALHRDQSIPLPLNLLAVVLREVADQVVGNRATEQFVEGNSRCADGCARGPQPDVGKWKPNRTARARWARAAEGLVDGRIGRHAYLRARAAAERVLGAAAGGSVTDSVRATGTAMAGAPSAGAMFVRVRTWRQTLATRDPIQGRGVLRELLEGVVPVRTGVGRVRVELQWSALGMSLFEAQVARRPTGYSVDQAPGSAGP